MASLHSTRRWPAAVVLAITGLLVTACGPTMGDMPLPGNGVSGDTIEVKVRFDEALNLAQGAKVKVNGVDSGKVKSVTTEDFQAIAVMRVRSSANMRANATARLRYTTPLGELFVDVTNPATGEIIPDGGELGKERASTAPTVEDALASASLLINGGGLAQLQTVTSEINKAIGGREDRVRSVLQRTDAFVRQANATTADFLRALDSLARLSDTLGKNKATINAALRDLRPAAQVLRENTPGFTRLLKEVNAFADTANGFVGATREDLLTMLKQVSPVLDEFLANRAVMAQSLNALVTASRNIDKVIPGDYANLLLELDLAGMNPPDLLGSSPSVSSGTAGGLGGLTGGGSGPLGGVTSLIPSLTNPLGTLLGGGSSGKTGESSGGLLGGLLGGNR